MSVSLATRGQTDMRGLGTAGRWFGRNGTACLGSSVAVSQWDWLLIVGSRVVPRAATGHLLGEAAYGCLVVHNGQRPAPAGQLAGDRDVRDGVPFAPLAEDDPPVMQSPVALIQRARAAAGRVATGRASSYPRRSGRDGARRAGRRRRLPVHRRLLGLPRPQRGVLATANVRVKGKSTPNDLRGYAVSSSRS